MWLLHNQRKWEYLLKKKSGGEEMTVAISYIRTLKGG